MPMSTVNLESFSAQLPTAADPFDLCLQTLSLDIFVPHDVPDVNNKSGGPNALPVKEQTRSWRTFTFPRPKSASGRVLKLFGEWFLSLSHEQRISVFQKHMQKPIKTACRTTPDNLESMCRLICLLHLQPNIDPKLCFTPVLIARPNHQNLVTDYLNGCDAAQLQRLQSDLNRLISNEKRIDEYSQRRSAQVTESRARVQECLGRCSDLLSKMDPVLTLSPPPPQARPEIQHSNGPKAQLKPEDRLKFTKLWTDGRENLVTLLSQQTFPNAADPFSLCMELINILSQSTNTWATLGFPKGTSYSGAVLEAFSKWFHSLNSTKRGQVFRNFVRKPISDACNAGNFLCMCRLATLLDLQRCFEPDLFIIPTHMQSHSQFVTDYLKGCDETLCKKFAGQLDALLALNEHELAKFSQQFHASVTKTHDKLANDIALYQKKYGLKDTAVPNLIARNKSPAALSEQAESSALLASVDAQSSSSAAHTDGSLESVTALSTSEAKQLWSEEGGRPKLIDSLSQTRFPTAIDPFKLCLELLSLQDWVQFRFPRPSCYSGAVFEAFTVWFGSLDSDNKQHVFEEFMKQAIIDAFDGGNFGAMCKLLTHLRLFEQFDNEVDLFLIPIQFRGQYQVVADYLNGCSQALCQRFARKLDELLAVRQTELDHLSQKYGAPPKTNSAVMKKSVIFYQQKYNFPDVLFPNLMASKYSQESSTILLSSKGPWKHLSPPQRRIELYKMHSNSVISCDVMF